MDDILKKLAHDATGMETYEYIVNHTDTCEHELPALIENLKKSDSSGQFLASTARFLHAVDPQRFDCFLEVLIESAIQKDKERKYIGSLLESLWGHDYQERAGELQRENDSFRRIFKRLYPEKSIDNKGHLL